MTEGSSNIVILPATIRTINVLVPGTSNENESYTSLNASSAQPQAKMFSTATQTQGLNSTVQDDLLVAWRRSWHLSTSIVHSGEGGGFWTIIRWLKRV